MKKILVVKLKFGGQICSEFYKVDKNQAQLELQLTFHPPPSTALHPPPPKLNWGGNPYVRRSMPNQFEIDIFW